MSLDPVRVTDTRAWLAKATNDLSVVAIVLSADPPQQEDAMFHCQQAVEKAFKAFLTWADVPFRRSHDLQEVGNQCATIDPSLQPIVDRAAPLSNYAWQFRYPSAAASPTHEEATEALALAREAVAAITVRLPAETHP
jgi:HEPN domain-containing protein